MSKKMASNIHGQWRICRIDDSLLLAQVFQGWNEAAFIQFSAELEQQLREMNNHNWAYIADARKWGLALPDSQGSLEELYLGVTGLVCNVTVVAQSVQQQAVEKMRTSEGKEVAPHFFVNNISQALDKAEQCGVFTDHAKVLAWFDEGNNF